MSSNALATIHCWLPFMSLLCFSFADLLPFVSTMKLVATTAFRRKCWHSWSQGATLQFSSAGHECSSQSGFASASTEATAAATL